MGTEMIKVLNILTDTNIGGAGRIFIQYLRSIDRSRFDVHIALPSGSALIPLVEAEGYSVIETEHSHDKSYERGAVKEYMGIIKEVRPDVVHTHSSLAGRIAAYRCGVRSRVYTRHCVFEPSKKLTAFPGKQVNGLLNNTLSTHIIGVCGQAGKDLCATGISKKKISVILNGVEPVRRLNSEERREFRRSVGIGEDEFVGLISARLEVYKGHRYLIDAAKAIREKYGDERTVRFVFMGDGSLKDELEAQCREAGVGDMIIFTGFVSDVAPWCNIMDVNLNSSLSEASSLALCEGMSLGVPAVVTDIGGNPEMITDGENGIIVPARDGGAIADAVLRLMGDAELYRKLSNGAFERYEREFTSAAMTRRIEAVYEADLKR